MKRILITGATAGIGRVAARELAKAGHEVIIVGRNPEKTARVHRELEGETGKRLALMLCDFSKQREVKALAADFLAKYDSLDVLLNNAGAINMSRSVTEDGFELTFATNHLGYYSLANLLVPVLSKSGKGRIVNVASEAHRIGKLDWEDIAECKRGYSPWRVYGTSKLCNILFTREMARRVADKGITVNCLHPGLVASEFLNRGGFWSFIKPLVYLFAVSEDTGAKTSIYLAGSDEVATTTGKYFNKCKVAKPWRWAEDDGSARRLWELSAKLTGIDTAGPANPSTNAP